MGNCFQSAENHSLVNIANTNDLKLNSVSPTSSMLHLRNTIKTQETAKSLHQKLRNIKKEKKLLFTTSDEDIDFKENFSIIQTKPISQQDKELILKVLQNHFFFSQMSHSNKEQLIAKMFYCKLNKSEYLFHQGDCATCYFILGPKISFNILDKGECQIIIDKKIIKTIHTGTPFGELALLFNAPRSASIRATTETFLWAIDRITFREAVIEQVSQEYMENRNFLDTLPFFDKLTLEQKDSIANVMINHQYKQNDVIVNQGDMAQSFYIIKRGEVIVKKDNIQIRKIYDRDTFGEQALSDNSVRGATVIASSEEVECVAFGKASITMIIGDKIPVRFQIQQFLKQIMAQNLLRWSLSNHERFSQLTKLQLEKIINKITFEQGKQGDKFLWKNTICNKLILVIEGELSFSSEIYRRGEMFGDQFLSSHEDQKLQHSLKFNTDGKIAHITYQKFFECIGGSLDQAIKRNSISLVRESSLNLKDSQKENLLLEQMIFIKSLGSGQFGQVYLLQSEQSNNLYALKCIVKNNKNQPLKKVLKQEKEVLEKIQFPFIMSMFKTFEDENYFLFLLEYIRGLELFEVLRKDEMEYLNNEACQFYIAQIILSLEYLHHNLIIYRDLKPENMIVDQDGYLKLIDMGTAKLLAHSTQRTFTLIGTPHYMAPEIIQGKGYSFPADLWSLGVILYEFMFLRLPFAEDIDDPVEIYEEIVQKQLMIPNICKAKQLLEQLLNKNQDMRLGESYAALKANQWFENFNWDKLIERQCIAPYIPSLDQQQFEIDYLMKQKFRILDKLRVDIQNLNYNGWNDQL